MSFLNRASHIGTPQFVKHVLRSNFFLLVNKYNFLYVDIFIRIFLTLCIKKTHLTTEPKKTRLQVYYGIFQILAIASLRLIF